MDELFQSLYARAEEKGDKGMLMDSLAEYHKMLCLLNGESLRSSGFTSFHHNHLMQIDVLEKVADVSSQLPLDSTIFKLANVPTDHKFSFTGVTRDFLSKTIQNSLLESELCNASPTETIQYSGDAPKLHSLFGSPQIEEEEVDQRPSKPSFSYSKSTKAKMNRIAGKKKKFYVDSDEEQQEEEEKNTNPFKSASEKLREDDRKKLRNSRGVSKGSSSASSNKSLGGKRRFNPSQSLRDSNSLRSTNKRQKTSAREEEEEEKERHPIFDDERMDKIEERMAELILSEILDSNVVVSWKDIAGLEFAKKSVMEIVVYPLWRPELFHGIRRPAKGLLLFGPPGTGKTMIGKAIASEAGATFFNISASSLTSKYVGEGEKMVRALFTVARCYPSDMKVIFIDEVDSLLTQRSENDIEASRRIKTEFLVQMDGAGNDPTERILVVGATNRPQEIDEAARRRFMKRLYIPLPNKGARRKMMENLLHDQNHCLVPEDLDDMAARTRGYSGSDMAGLCSEAAFGPIRSLNEDIRNVVAANVRPISRQDFQDALAGIRASVSDKDLELYKEWNGQFGSFGDPPVVD